MAPGGCVPDAESHASRARGTHVPRREASRSEFADSSCGWDDEAGRCGLLHSRALLPVAEFEISARHAEALAASAGHAHGWTARGDVACIDSEESWLHASGGRTRSRRSGERYGRYTVLRSVRGAGTVQEARIG